MIMTTLFVSLTMVFVACEPKYRVQVRANEGGTIDGQSGEYAEGEIVVFKAVPDDGYFFVGWSDRITDNPRTITVGSDDIYLMASFATTVDLGLSSGTLWATNNLGALDPINNGSYYAWGEISTKKEFSWKNYKYGSGYHDITKYCSIVENGRNGFTDNLHILDDSDNVVVTTLGDNWLMPTVADFQELYNECYWVSTTDYNNYGWGFIVYKSADKSKDYRKNKDSNHKYSPTTDTHIFLPASGFYSNSEHMNTAGGYYWTPSLKEDEKAYCFSFNRGFITPDDWSFRNFGMTVRPIHRK